MKYLRKFDKTSDVMMFDTPNVVLVRDTSEVLYNVPPPTGVYIQHVDGRLFTKDKWVEAGFANDEANGIAVIDNAKSFVVAKQGMHVNTKWSSSTTEVTGILTATTQDIAAQDYAGKENTAVIISAVEGPAAQKARNYTFPCGTEGYLPAAGELVILYNYKNDFDAAAAVVGGNSLSSEYWSSTQASESTAWRWKSSSISTATKTTASYVRPFMPI